MVLCTDCRWAVNPYPRTSGDWPAWRCAHPSSAVPAARNLIGLVEPPTQQTFMALSTAIAGINGGTINDYRAS